MSRWHLERAVGPAGGFHARDVPAGSGRSVWSFAATASALVLGSAQPEADVDTAAAERLGVEVVRRRSGGGAVLLDRGQVAWVDVVVPRGDELWHDDVVKAAEWLGVVWSAALGELGVPGGVVHRGGLVRTPLAPVVCFAGTGPGEVLVGGAKAVGISQRRTRHHARFQCAVPLAWDPERHAALLGPGIGRALPGVDPASAMASVAVRAGTGLDGDDVLDAFLAHLP